MGLSRGVGTIQGGSSTGDGEDGDGGEGSNILGLLSGVLGSLSGVSIFFTLFLF